MAFSPAFANNDTKTMTTWFIVTIVAFAIIFAVNSSIHSYLVVKYAKSDKLAVSVGFYYMSNALGRLFGTICSGVLYTYVGEYVNEYAGTNATSGFAACFLAGTISSLLAALITVKIDDNDGGLKCGSCTVVREKPIETVGLIETDEEAKEEETR